MFPESSPAFPTLKSVLGDRAHLHLGEADHLPFDDREFDYTSLMTVLEFVDDPAHDDACLFINRAARR